MAPSLRGTAATGPDLQQVLKGVLKHGRVEGVDDELAFTAGQHQSGITQNLKMMRHRGERDRKLGGQLAGRAIPVSEQGQNPPAGWVSEGAKRLVEHLVR